MKTYKELMDNDYKYLNGLRYNIAKNTYLDKEKNHG